MATKGKAGSKPDTGANLGFEAKLWQMADGLRNNMDAAEYKHVVLGLIFLKYISDAFESKHAELETQKKQGADPEDPDEYKASRIFWVPKEARWSHLKAKAPQPTIGTLVDDAMSAIERDNPSLKGVLPKDYARPGLDKQRLGQLINLVSDIGLGSPTDRAKDILGRVYEYFLSQFASAEGKKGGQFYTPSRVVRVLVEMLAPYKGRVYDPCCGSGGMFVSSEKFIEAHSGKLGDISIYGQESNYTTWRLAKMNLAIRGIDAQIAHGDTFHNDKHPDLKADYVLANPPFNDSDWRGELLKDDKRWVYGMPPAGNANFAWVQHFIHHLAPTGLAGFVLANGSMSSNQSGEGEIRKAIIEADLVDCMVALPGQLFYSTQIPVCLWFICRDKSGKPSPGLRPPSPSGRGARGEGAKHEGEGSKHYRGGYDFAGLVEAARMMRKKQTPAEIIFWELVRDRQFMGLKFRRQHQLGDYMADFYCHEHRLVIELDGSVHSEKQKKDHKCDAWMKAQEFTVLRFPNQQLLDDPEFVLQAIAEVVRPAPPQPLPLGEGQGEGVGAGAAYDHLFPDSFEDSQLGEIPRGWKVKAFADTIEIVGGGTPKTSVAEYWDGDIPWFSVVDAPTASDVWVVDTEKKVTRAGVENSSTRVLPMGTTIISARGTVGRIAVVGVAMAMNQSCYGLRGRAGAHGFFTYFSTRELVARLQQHAHGSVFDTITRDTLAGVSVVAPAAALIEEFEKRVAPILLRMRAGLLETRTLAALRDTLLPKLISGEIRIRKSIIV